MNDLRWGDTPLSARGRAPFLVCLAISILGHALFWVGGGASHGRTLADGPPSTSVVSERVPRSVSVTLLAPTRPSPAAKPEALAVPAREKRPAHPLAQAIVRTAPLPPPPRIVSVAGWARAVAPPRLPQPSAYPTAMEPRHLAVTPSTPSATAPPPLIPSVPAPVRTPQSAVAPAPAVAPRHPYVSPTPPALKANPSPAPHGVWGDSLDPLTVGARSGQRNATPVGFSPRVRGAKKGTVASSVLVELTIHRDGKVSAVLLRSTGDDALDHQVQAAMEQWKWLPAMMNGRPVDSKATVPFDIDAN